MQKRWMTLCVLLAACQRSGSVSKTAPEILVGEYSSLTGTEATFGQSTHNGVTIAFDDINAAGGIHGRKIRLITEDDQSKAEEAASAVTKLISSNSVAAIIGEVASSNSLAAAPICESAKVPMITPSSTNPEVTKKGDYIFRMCFLDTYQGPVLAKFVANDLHITRAILPRLLSFCYSSSRSVGRENRAQSAHRVGDFRYSRAAKAQNEPLARGRPEIGRREWPQPQILACGSCGYNAVTVSFWQYHSQVQARLGTVHLQDGIEFFPDAVHKDLSAIAVHQPHSPDVSREVPFVDEIREHRLI